MIQRTKILLILSAIGYGWTLQGQNIVGQITESGSIDPVAFATIYLANTTIGTISATDGQFLLKVDEPGKYDLVVSCVGYERLILPLVLMADSTYTLYLELEPDLLQLEEVLVTPDSAERARYLPDFIRNFLGDPSFSSSCMIQNLDQIQLLYDKDIRTLSAYSREPVIISNPELGWTLHYDMVQFELDYRRNLLYNFGIYRFELDSIETRRVSKQRTKAYQASMMRFFTSLFDEKNLFRTFSIYYSPPPSENDGIPIARRVTSKNIHQLLQQGSEETMLLREGVYRIEVKDAFQHKAYPFDLTGDTKLRPISTLNVKKPITIYRNGYVDDVRDILVTGYWSWYEKIAHSLPLAYQPK